MEENKYYVPEIDEFHVGFEYEIFEDFDVHPEKIWHKQEFGKHGNNPEAMGYVSKFLIRENLVRVKYLDKEDIEAEGFEYDNNHEPIPRRKDSLELPKSYFKDDQLYTGQLWILSHYEKDNVIWIEYTKDCGVEGYLFKGVVKNRSELGRILKMIGV